MKYLQIIAFSSILMLTAACESLLVGTPEIDTPTANFNSMWEGYDRWYGQFIVRDINWDSVYAETAPLIHDDMTDAELYTVLCQMIDPLDDIHVFLQPTTGGLPRFESAPFFQTHHEQDDVSMDVIAEKYAVEWYTIDENWHYGMLENNIAYIHFGEFAMPLSFYQQHMPEVMNLLSSSTGMIIDIRDHAGGDDQVSQYLSGWFAAERKLFMTTQKRSGPAHDDFGPVQEWYTDPQGGSPYTKPVMLLQGPWTASAGETFALALRTQDQVTAVGGTTAGGFSDVISRELPNGWLYFVSVGDYRAADGQSYEGVGLVPQVSAVTTPEDLAAGVDPVLETALSGF